MRKLLAVFIALLIPVIARSDPSISNVSDDTPYNGQSITITGLDFGTHALDVHTLIGVGGVIEATTTGNTPTDANGWRYTGSPAATVVETQAHSGAKSLYWDLNSSTAYTGLLRYTYGDTIGVGGVIYVTWWTRRNVDGGGPGQWKMFRVQYADSYLDADSPQFKMFNWAGDANGYQFFVSPGPGTTDQSQLSGMVMPSQNNRWYRIEVAVTCSAETGLLSNGSYTLSIHDPDSSVAVDDNTDTAPSFNTANPYYKYFCWQNNIGNGITNQDTWIDDPYIQIGTVARVELGDASTWVACTQRDIQPASAWATDSVTLTLNAGSSTVSDVRYLYVVKSDGTVNSNGYEVTIADASGPATLGCKPFP